MDGDGGFLCNPLQITLDNETVMCDVPVVKPKTTTEVRKRSRHIPEIPVPPQIPAHIDALARQVFVANKQMNEAKREHDSKRKLLLTEMDKVGAKAFRTTALDEKQEAVILDVKVATPTNEVIAVDKLRGLVTDEVFMKIISATKKSVVDHAGNVVVTQCTKLVDGTRNVFVSAAE